jgi:hypothetical protein
MPDDGSGLPRLSLRADGVTGWSGIHRAPRQSQEATRGREQGADEESADVRNGSDSTPRRTATHPAKDLMTGWNQRSPPRMISVRPMAREPAPAVVDIASLPQGLPSTDSGIGSEPVPPLENHIQTDADHPHQAIAKGYPKLQPNSGMCSKFIP